MLSRIVPVAVNSFTTLSTCFSAGALKWLLNPHLLDDAISDEELMPLYALVEADTSLRLQLVDRLLSDKLLVVTSDKSEVFPKLLMELARVSRTAGCSRIAHFEAERQAVAIMDHENIARVGRRRHG